MRVLVAPQTFKGTFSGMQVAEAIASSIHGDVITLPVADGGDGTLDLFLSLGAQKQTSLALDPLENEIFADWAEWQGVAVIELAKVAGLSLMERLDPLHATTYGVGMLIRAAFDQGHRHFIIGLGGSGTCDGGKGIADALKFDPRVQESHFLVACDVRTTVRDAARIYGPQKGATQNQVKILEKRLIKRFPDLLDLPYGGAAGATAAGLVQDLGAALRPGAEMILDLIGFDEKLEGVDLVITGEGRIDSQSLEEKALSVVVRRAWKRKIPTVAIVGEIGEGYQPLLHQGLKKVIQASTLEEIRSVAKNIFLD